jgi:hypothetical protein
VRAVSAHASYSVEVVVVMVGCLRLLVLELELLVPPSLYMIEG